MSPTRDLPDRELKDRQKQLYGREDHAGANLHPRKAFADYLRETPAAPLSTPLKAALIAAAVVVGLAFLASLFQGLNRQPHPTRRAGSPTRTSQPAETQRLLTQNWMDARTI